MTVLALIVLAVISFLMGRSRSRLVAVSRGGVKAMHSLPKHYGYLTAIWAALPAFILLVLWVAFEPTILRDMVINSFPAEIQLLSESRIGLYLKHLVGYANGYLPKFVKRYTDIHGSLNKALKEYAEDVMEGKFPDDRNSYHLKKKEILAEILKDRKES